MAAGQRSDESLSFMDPLLSIARFPLWGQWSEPQLRFFLRNCDTTKLDSPLTSPLVFPITPTVLPETAIRNAVEHGSHQYVVPLSIAMSISGALLTPR